MKLTDLVHRQATAGKWYSRDFEFRAPPEHRRAIYHYDTLMLTFVLDGNGRWDRNPSTVAGSIGHGSQSDQRGMNRLFRELGIDLYFERAGGARVISPFGVASGFPTSHPTPNTRKDAMHVTTIVQPTDTIFDRLIELFDSPVLQAFLTLANEEDQESLKTAWEEWSYTGTNGAFLRTVKTILGYEAVFCSHCDEPQLMDETTYVSGDYICDECLDEHYHYCSECEEYTRYELYEVDDREYCEYCRDRCCSYCDHCDQWYRDENSDDHSHRDDCECQAPNPVFKFPANGKGVIAQNERLTVELPKGTIDDQGIRRIRRLLWTAVPAAADYVDGILDETGNLWQAKRGNFTKRLSSGLFKHGFKLDPETISEIGNLARQHSSEGSEWHIEFTRDLNGSADEFVHEDSCWWGSYYASRCALKNWGGLGLRSYAYSTADSYEPDGRAWVQPLNANLRPTHDTLGAHAYVVFNGYGDLEGYIPARIVAHLTGRTYKKIGYSSDAQYVNNESGYLVADEATCEDTERIYIYGSEHERFDANEDFTQGHLPLRESAA